VIWVLSGTRDAREIIERLKSEGFDILASAVTERGRQLAKESGAIVTIGALDSKGMTDLILTKGIKAVIDATHPFAVEASINAMRACNEEGAPYLRFERKQIENLDKGIHQVENFGEAGVKAAELGEIIFYAAGSRNIDVFLGACPGKKVIARVLDDAGNVEKCIEFGVRREDIITATPPFTIEENRNVFKKTKADVLVTKESGAVGGLLEKIDAASNLGMKIVLVKRPTLIYPSVLENYNEVVQWVKKH